MRQDKDVRVNVFNPRYTYYSHVKSLIQINISHRHVSFFTRGWKVKSPNKIGKVLTISSVFFAIFRNLHSQVQELSGVSILFYIRLDLHLLSWPKLLNLQFTQIPNLDYVLFCKVLWNYFCTYTNIHIILFLIFHFLIKASHSAIFCFCFPKKFNDLLELNI